MTTTLTPELIEQVRNLSETDWQRVCEAREAEYTPEELQQELQARWDEYVANPSIAMSMDDFLKNMQERIAARKSL